MATPYLPESHPPINPETKRFNEVWLAALRSLFSQSGGGNAPANATYVLTVSSGLLPNSRVAANSATITVNLSTAGQISWDVTGGVAPPDAEYIVAALSSGLSAERVATDTSTIAWDFSTPGQAKASVIDGGSGAGSWSLLTNGDPVNPELIFAGGDVISMWVPL